MGNGTTAKPSSRLKPKSVKKKPTTLKIKILLPVAGRFNLSYNVGQTYTIEAKQAQELIDRKYAEKA